MKSLKYVQVVYGWRTDKGIRYDSGAKKINVSGCTSLQELYCSFYDGESFSSRLGEGFLESLDASGCTSLQKLYCSNQQLKELNVKGCTALQYLYCINCDLTELDVSGLASMQMLSSPYCYSLTKLNLKGCTVLNYLDCYANKLPELDLSECTALQKLYCSENKLTELDLSANTDLAVVNCYSNQLARINVRNCPSLQQLWCYKNQLTALNLSNNTALKYLRCQNNRLQALDVGATRSLEVLRCEYNRLPLLDVVVNTSLKTGSNNNGDYCKFSPQNIDGLVAVRQADGTYAVNLRDYLAAKIKNVVANSIYAKDDDGKLHDPLSFNEKTGIAVFDTPPATVYYEYDTKFDKDNVKRYMSVTLAASSSPESLLKLASLTSLFRRATVL